MKKIVFAIITLSVLAACGDATENTKIEVPAVVSADNMLENLKKIDDSISNVITNAIKEQKKVPVAAYQKAIEQHLAFYNAYATDERAAESLDKAQSFYTQLKAEDKARIWRDTIIYNFKGYKNRPRVLETQGFSYDYDNYQPEKMKFYYTMLLEDYPNMDSVKREEVQFRLDHIDLSFEELIELRINEAQ